MAYPFNSQGQLGTEQAILGGAADVIGTTPVLRVSSVGGNVVTSVTTSPLSADSSSVSAIQEGANRLRMSAIQEGAGALMVSAKSNDGALMRVSAVQDGAAALNVSAKSDSGATFRVSALSNDAGTLRMSAIGGTAGDNTLVDGVTQTVSAVIVSSHLVDLGSLAASSRRAIIFTMQNEDAVEAPVSAKSQDAGLFLVSAILRAGTANIGYVSATVDNGSISAKQGDAANLNVSGKSNDAGLFLVSAILRAGTANIGYVSATIDNGSVSAKQSDAGNLMVSAKSNDGALNRVSAVQDGAAALNVSAKSDDGGKLRVSSFNSVVTTNTGGASIFSTSAGIAVVSTVKSTAGRLYGYHLSHQAGVDQYLVVFNTSGGATLATDVPTLYLGVPAGTGANAGAGAIMSLGPGIGFSTGIQVAVVSAVNGSTAGASAMRVNLFYA